MENHKIANSHYKLEVKNSMLDGSSFSTVSLKNLRFDDVTMIGTKISNANITGLEIDGARMSGAIFRNIGTPPEGHSALSLENKHVPILFERCDFKGSKFDGCNMEGVELVNCNIKGLKINGISVQELINRLHS